MKLYAIKDDVACEFQPPFLARNDAHAIRIFGLTIAQDEYAKGHSDEFSLYNICDWNRISGTISRDGPGYPRRVSVTLDNAFEEEGNGQHIPSREG